MSWKDSAIPVSSVPIGRPSGSWRESAISVNQTDPKQTAPQEEVSAAVKVPLGFAVGIAEGMNPLAIPRTVETAVRSLREESDPQKGFFGRLAERFGKAEAKSVIPKMNVDQIAAGTRTGIDVVANLFSGNVPTVKEIGKTFELEKKSQQNFNDMLVSPGAKTAGEVLTGVASLGSLAKDVASGVGLLKKTQGFANEAAVSALKPSKAAYKILSSEKRIQPLGAELNAEGVPGLGISWKSMASKVSEKLDEWGKKVGHFGESADKAVARDSSIRGVLVDGMASDVSNKLVPQLVADGKADVARAISDWVETNLKAAGPGGEIGFTQAQRIKNTLQATKAKFGTANDTAMENGFQDLYRVLNDHIENGIETALKKAGSSEELSQFLEAKQKYGLYKKAGDILNNTVASKDANRLFSLSDHIVGTGTGAAEMVRSGPKGVAIGLAGAIANKLLRERGNQALAGLLNLGSKNNVALESIFKAGGVSPAQLDGIRKLVNQGGTFAGSINTLRTENP